jgi:hypothetical protein
MLSMQIHEPRRYNIQGIGYGESKVNPQEREEYASIRTDKRVDFNLVVLWADIHLWVQSSELAEWIVVDFLNDMSHTVSILEHVGIASVGEVGR